MPKKTPLTDVWEHEYHAKMVEFAGYLMPVQFQQGIIKEHLLVRKSVGLFPISHMGEFMITGKDAEKFMQYIMTNDLHLLYDGKAQYACICYENGTTADDCFYYRYDPEHFRIIINAANIEKDLNWLNKHAGSFDVTISDISKQNGRFSIQGPNTAEVLNPIIDADITSVKRFHFIQTKMKGIDLFVACTGYTGEYGFEISFPASESKKVLDYIMESGEKFGISPIGLGARDTLRLEACYSLYGHELSDKITPIEADIGFCVKEKEEDFIGKEILLKQKKEGTSRKIVAVELKDKGIIRNDYKVFNESGEKEIGYVTSGTYSPTFKKSIGLALLQIDYCKVGTKITVQVRNKKLNAEVVKRPFYQYHGKPQ